MKNILSSTFLLLALTLTGYPVEWVQDAYNAQRSGYTPEQPMEPWDFLWTWNGPDAAGGTNGHWYHQPQLNVPWEARIVTGGDYIYAPASDSGLYAIVKTNGTEAWNVTNTAFNVTPAYYPSNQCLYAGGDDGLFYKIAATNGSVVATYNASNSIGESVLIANNCGYIVTDSGELHKVDLNTMTGIWTYAAGAYSHTPPAYSADKEMLVYCTTDLYVHAVNDLNGSRKWKVKPAPGSPANRVEFEGGWPVIAEQHGLVLLRLRTGNEIWSGTLTGGTWPTNMSEIRDHLIANPQHKNLYVLDLDDGTEPFLPAVGPGGVEDYLNGGPTLRVGQVPVVKTLPNGDEVAYTSFRSAQEVNVVVYDGRWDSKVGEMVLDSNTIAGLASGDLRYIDFPNSSTHITDEQCPLVIAGNTLFHNHWAVCASVTITNRDTAVGMTGADPIQTVAHEPVVRRVDPMADYDPTNHYSTAGSLPLFGDGRSFTGPGWWVYWNVMDPPNPIRGAFSEGVQPRYSVVADGMIIVVGNGGDLLALSHSGPITDPPTAQAAVSTNIGIVPLTVHFTGTGTDNDGTIASYLWNFGDGSSSTNQNPSHTYTNSGDYTAVLTVTDNDSATDADSVAVTVSSGNPVPVINASPTSGTVPLTVQLAGTNSIDVNGSIVSYIWDLDDGSTSDLAAVTHRFTTTGVFNVSLIVTDNEGNATTGTVSISVTEPTALTAVAVADPTAGSSPLLVSFTGSAYGGGSTGTAPNLLINGSFEDSDLGSSSVVDPGWNGYDGRAITVQDTYSDSGTQAALIDNAGPGIELHQEVTGLNTGSVYTYKAGIWLAEFTTANGWSGDGLNMQVTDGKWDSPIANVNLDTANGGWTEYSLTFTPPADGSAYMWIKPLYIGSITAYVDTVWLYEGTNDPSTPPAYSYFWEFGDAQTSTNATVDHTYNADGIYTARLSVTDGVTGTNTDTVIIMVGTDGDTDSDGIPDAWETTHFGNTGTADGTTDKDGDGMLDIQEYISGTEPTNAASYFSVGTPASGSAGHLLSWHAVSSKVYNLEWSSNLYTPFELLLSNWTAGADGAITFTDSVHHTDSQVYYRLRVSE